MSLSFEPLTWMAIGFALMALEIILPGFVVFWFGIGSLLTALLVKLVQINDASWQWLIFFVSSFAFLSFWHFYLKKFFKKDIVDDVPDPTVLNLRGRVVKKIEPGKIGEVELFTAFHGIRKWKALSLEILEEEDEIMVLGSEGVSLRVEKLKK